MQIHKKIEITIVNWDKYQIRKDRKHHHWFKLLNNAWRSQQLYYFDAVERWTWICLLSYCSERQGEKFEIDPEWFCKEANIDGKHLINTLEKFVKNDMILMYWCQSDTDRLPAATDRLSIIEEREERYICTDLQISPNGERLLLESSKLVKTEATNGSDPTSPHDSLVQGPKGRPPHKGRAAPPAFDFEALYQLYPRKEGKTRGLTKCKKEIKTQEDYDNLRKAILTYNKINHGKDKDYIKHFSSFMGVWRDYLDPNLCAGQKTQEKRPLGF